jgi:hypothetical protein
MEIHLDYKPHKYQKLVHQACSLSPKNPYKFVVCVSSRKGGKSFCGQAQLDLWMWYYPGAKRIWVVNPTENQSIEWYDAVLSKYLNTGLIKKADKTKGLIRIKFVNGCLVEFKSAGSGDSLRGPKIDLLLIDEAAYLPHADYNINTVLLPMLTTSRYGKVLFMSTPAGKKNHLFKKYLAGQDNKEKEWFSVKFTYKENPEADQSYVESLRSIMGEHSWRVEYGGEFLEAGSVFENVANCIDSNISTTYDPALDFYAGLDVALEGKDENALCILNDRGELVFLDHFNKTKLPAVKKRLMNSIKAYAPKYTYIEKAGMSFMYESLFYEHNVEGLRQWNQTNESKGRLIVNLINAFAEKEIKIPDHKELQEQLDAFITKVTPSGNRQYESASGRDDLVIALSLAWTNYVTHKSSGTYFFD